AADAPEPAVLKLIDMSSLPDELRAQLQDAIGQYQDQSLNNGMMQQIQRSATSIDKHLLVRWQMASGNNGERIATVRLSLPYSGGAFADGPPPPGPPPPPSDTPAPPRIRVGGNVQQTKLI